MSAYDKQVRIEMTAIMILVAVSVLAVILVITNDN